uniref:Reverse transcriptase Ty1/copia-type domain-containing protein n=1 Tax=Tanacetum cinerariifolium TaxID=118510 RepID=A0A6L2NM59_TANCI|nr:hypothetical protein [Tanacetum cinerariifolium]
MNIIGDPASGFESSEFPDYVCKLDKTLYGLKQAPMAWYETLFAFLIQNKFTKGIIDNMLFIYKSKRDVVLVQVYVDDIIFGSTSYKLCKQFEKLMTKKFEISMMGELTYFLGLQIKQDEKGISICQEQYIKNLLKKYEISDSSLVKTPMVPPNNLGPDLAGKPVNKTSYRGMIRSLMYLTATRPDIQFSTLLYVRYQSNLKESHLTTVKRIFRCCQILGGKLVCWSAKKEQSVAMSSAQAEYVAAAGCCASIMDHILKGDIELHIIPTEYQLADIFTKPLDEPTFTRLKAELSMVILGQRVRGNKPPADMKPINPTVANPSGTGAKYQVDHTQSTKMRYQSLTKNEGKPSHEGELDTQPLVLSTYANVRAFLLSDDEAQESKDDILGAGEEINEDPHTTNMIEIHHHWEKHEEAAFNYANVKASIDEYYNENIAHRYQTDKLVKASMSSLDKSSTTITYLYKGLNVITELLKEINNAIKDDPVIKKKISEATKSFTKISTNIIKVHALKQDEELAAWVKSSTNMAWNPGSRLSASFIIRPDPDALIPYTINREAYYLTAEKLQVHMDKEEKIKKAKEEYILFAISNLEVIKVVREEAKKIGIHPKEAITTKAGNHSRKKNAVVQDLMNSLSQRYERIRKILKELGIKSALPALDPAPKQASSKSSRKKRKHMELEPERKIPGLECNRALPENVSFVHNMVIKEPEHGIFFTAASMVQSPENARFSMKLKKLIAEHLDQKKLKSKKVKLEALGYEMN